MLEFRLLNEDEIEVRVARSNETCATLLLYKNARCDMSMLDETVGPENWQREHYACKDTLFCRVGIRIGDAWVWKSDAGEPSNVSSEKGESSDSFKRACANWGIGRELYTFPNILVWRQTKDGQINYELDSRGKMKTRFVCTHIAYNEKRQISELNIESVYPRKTVFTLIPPDKATPAQIMVLKEEIKKHGRTQAQVVAYLKEHFEDAPNSINQITGAQFGHLMNIFNRGK